MLNKKKVFAIIPAKKYSKRLKNKNLKKINNKTLLEITINSVKKSKYIDHIIISTDSKKIIEISEKLKCEVIKRPLYLSSEKALVNDVINHSIKKIIKDYKLLDFIIILLHVTSPLRTYRDINSSFYLMKTKLLKGILSVKKVNPNLLKSIFIKKNKIIPVNKEIFLTSNDQFLPKLYKPNGSIYIFQSKDSLWKPVYGSYVQ
jgi:CMP-N-acetylneuraminic acid synthetase